MSAPGNQLPDEQSYRVIRDTRRSGALPRISVIVAVYDVERYIIATLRSLTAQRSLPDGCIEYIFVSDNSPDRSVELIERWARGRSDTVVAEANENGGPGHARNIAMKLARGMWVTSVDPDDVVSELYFAEVLRMLDAGKNQEIALISTRVMITEDGTGRFTDTHPLGRKFRYGNRFVRLNQHPECVQLGATVFLQRNVLEKFGITYDTRCRPTFEDGGLIGKYLAHFREPIVGLASTAHYFYRKRDSNDSAVQKSFSVPERYTNVLRFGYLAMLNSVREAYGETPRWASNMVLYDLAWYFKQDDSMKSVASWIDGPLRREFLDLAREILRLIPAVHIEEFFLNPVPWSMRQAWLLWAGTVRSNARLVVWSNGGSKADFSVLTGPQVSKLDIRVNGREVAPHDIVGRHTYRFFRELFMVETTVRTNCGDIAVFADDQPIRSSRVVNARWPESPMDEAMADLTERVRRVEPTPRDKRRERLFVRALIKGDGFGTEYARGAVSRLNNRREDRLLDVQRHNKDRESESRRLLGDAEFVARWEGCWVLLDHIGRADDNAEHLERFILKEHPEIKTVYLLGANSKDWHRLQDEGFPLVEYGSAEAWAISALASLVVSSDAVEECMYPAPRAVFGSVKSKFVFLQHGISDKDISRWLNNKRIDLLTAATQGEYDAFTKVDSPYKLTTDEVVLTGFPRYDELECLRASRGNFRLDSGGDGHTILIMPTWRQYLAEAFDGDAVVQDKIQAILSSTFGSAWFGLMESTGLLSFAYDHDVRLRFLLHPNLTALTDALQLDPLVEIVPTVDISFQEELYNASALLTDYSSLAFDAAYLGIPVAYYRFDEPELIAGRHSWRPGYFDYERDGLGPCLRNASSVEQWASELVDSSFTVDKTYAERARRTFRYFDGDNCRRVFEAISRLC